MKHLGKGLPIGVVITLAAVALVLATGGVILLSVYRTSSEITRELIRDKAEIVHHSIVQRVSDHLLPIELQADFLAGALREIDIAKAGKETIGELLYASLAAAPQVSSLALVDRNFHLVRAFRNRPPTHYALSDWSDDLGFIAMMVEARIEGRPHWGPLFYAESSDTTFLNYLTPFEDAAGQVFVLVASVSLTTLSEFLRSLQSEVAGTPFILYGDRAVLAHGQLAEGYAGLSDRQPLPRLADYSDKVLARIWSPGQLGGLEADLANGLEARVLQVDDETYVFLFQRAEAFGAVPWTIGNYVTLDSVASQLTRNRAMVTLGLIVIAGAMVLALVVSRLISRPIRRLGAMVDSINNWELDTGTAPRHSLFREINEANAALFSAIKGLRSLKVYLPHGLALRLIQREDDRPLEAEERVISVLFTDIVGFTAVAEAMAPKAVLELLNEHFTLVSTCIREEEGNVDKFIGDSAMAFWGGLESDRDHATHACRAAVRIIEAVERDNARRQAEGLQPIHLCIGVHSGSAMVGDIGPAGRMNYTVIGDTVNTAQRLEALGREVRRPDSDAVCLISGETAKRLERSAFRLSPVGCKVLHGRHDETEVFRLEAKDAGTAALPAAGQGTLEGS